MIDNRDVRKGGKVNGNIRQHIKTIEKAMEARGLRLSKEQGIRLLGPKTWKAK